MRWRKRSASSPGMACREAGLRLIAARPSDRDPEPCGETRRVLDQPGWRRRIVLINSASLISPDDAGQIVVTASHGALVGGNAQMALQVDAFAAVFSDAGVGSDNAGISRLPALDGRGIAGLAVSAASARIGDAASDLRRRHRLARQRHRATPRRSRRRVA